MTLKELNSAFDTVKKSDRVVQMGTQVRSWAAPVAGRLFVQSGGLGRIYKVEQSRNASRPYRHPYGERKVEAADVEWKAFLMHRKPRPFDPVQYGGWYGFRDFSQGPQSNLACHYFDLVHYVTGAKYPKSVVASGGKYRFQDRYDCVDQIEIVMEYDGFLSRYNTTFGTAHNSFLKFFGTRGVLDATRWNRPWIVTGEPREQDRAADGPLPEAETTDHMKNFLECVGSRKAPAAPIEAGYAHAITALMADESMLRGARVVYDPVKRAIREG
jgi:predicted dehydrogenase